MPAQMATAITPIIQPDASARETFLRDRIDPRIWPHFTPHLQRLNLARFVKRFVALLNAVQHYALNLGDHKKTYMQFVTDGKLLGDCFTNDYKWCSNYGRMVGALIALLNDELAVAGIHATNEHVLTLAEGFARPFADNNCWNTTLS